MAKLYFKYGAMGSSKTAQALITKYNYEENGLQVWLLKPSADMRDGAQILRSRIGLEARVEIIGPSEDIYTCFRERKQGSCDVIIVDECQFLEPEQVDFSGDCDFATALRQYFAMLVLPVFRPTQPS